MREGKQPRAMNNINNLLPFTDEKETSFSPANQSIKSSYGCKLILSILEMVKTTHPERQLQVNASIAGKFLPEVVEPIDTERQLVRIIAYLTNKRLPKEYVGDFLKEIISKDLRFRYTRDEVVAIHKCCRKLEGFSQSMFIQLLSPKISIDMPTHFTCMISVPPTNDPDNHRSFKERYQIIFENGSLVPVEDCGWLRYCDESGVNFLHNRGSGHRDTRIGSGCMVILGTRHQRIIGIISETGQPITLDSLAVKSACHQLLKIDGLVNRDEVVKLARAIDRSFRYFSDRHIPTRSSSINKTYLQLESLIGSVVTLWRGGIFSTGEVIGMWPGRSCSINLTIGKYEGTWLELSEFGKVWKLMKSQE